MVTADRPTSAPRAISVEEVEHNATLPTIPPELPAKPLHAGTPYVKGPPPLSEFRAATTGDTDWPVRDPAPDSARGWEAERAAQNTKSAVAHSWTSTAEWASAPCAPGDLVPPEPLNPKTLVGRTKVPMLSVIPATSLVKLARALQYGAFHAPRKDREQPGYGPQNWRDQKIEFMTYIDAAMRHLLASADGEDIDPDTGDLQCDHLDLAMATLAILIDARTQGTCIDDRHTLPGSRGEVGAMLRRMRKDSQPKE